MVKKSISLILVICMVLSITCVYAAAAQSGAISEDLSWELSTVGRLTISGKGDTIPDYSPESPAPWAKNAAQVKTLSLPNSLRHIGAYAFDGCAQLKKIDFGKTQTIGAYSFRMCGFEQIELPYTLSAVAPYAFSQCSALKTVTFHEIQYGALDVQKREGVTLIGEGAFSDCTALTALNSYLNNEAVVAHLPATLATVGKEAFSGCEQLSTIAFDNAGKNLTSLGEGAFAFCTALKAFDLPAGISTVPKDCFMSAGLQSVRLPANITAVGEDAFAFCDALTTVDVINNNCTFYHSENTTPDTAKLRVLKDAANAISYANRYKKPVEVLCTGRRTHSAGMFGKWSVSQKASAAARGALVRSCGS